MSKPISSKPNSPAAPGKEIYYGWKIVTAILVMLTFTSGLSFYNHSIYLNALAAQSVFTVQTASIAVSIFFFSGGIAGLWVAKWVQAYDPRLCIIAGAIISFVALSSLGFVTTIGQLYLAYVFFGIGFSATSLIPATTLVTRWFHKKRAMALSIASTGLSLGGVIVTPLCVLLVDALGFTLAAPVMGVIFLIGVIPVAWIWLRADPQSMGLMVDGELAQPKSDESVQIEEARSNAATTQRRPSIADGISFEEARRGRFFWGISTAYIFLMMAQVGGIAHQYGLVREVLTESQTAIAVAILPVASIVGRLIGGWLIGQMSIRLFSIYMMVLQCISMLVLAGGHSIISLCIGLALFGTTVGNLLMLQPLLIAEAFGVRDYAKIFSIANLMSSWGTAAGPALLGYMYVANGNLYQLPYTAAAIAAVIGLALFLAGGRIKN